MKIRNDKIKIPDDLPYTTACWSSTIACWSMREGILYDELARYIQIALPEVLESCEFKAMQDLHERTGYEFTEEQ